MFSTRSHSLFFAVLLITSLAACGQEPSQSPTVSQPNSSPTRIETQIENDSPSRTSTVTVKDARTLAQALLNEGAAAGEIRALSPEYADLVRLETVEIASANNGVVPVVFSSAADKKGGYKIYFFREENGTYRSVGSLGVYVSKLEGNVLPVGVWSNSLPNDTLRILLTKGGNELASQSVALAQLARDERIVFENIADQTGLLGTLRATLIFE